MEFVPLLPFEVPNTIVQYQACNIVEALVPLSVSYMQVQSERICSVLCL